MPGISTQFYDRWRKGPWRQQVGGTGFSMPSSPWLHFLFLFLVPQALFRTEQVCGNPSWLDPWSQEDVSPLREPGTFRSAGRGRSEAWKVKDVLAVCRPFWSQRVTGKRQNAPYSKGSSVCSSDPTVLDRDNWTPRGHLAISGDIMAVITWG